MMRETMASRMAMSIRALVSLLMAMPAIGVAWQAPQPAAIIGGRVVDAASGRGIAHATVTARSSASYRIVKSTFTTPDGTFRIAGLGAGSHSITTRAAGYLEGGYGRRWSGGPTLQLPLTAGQTVGDLTIRMWAPAIVSGRVLSEADQPMAGVSVTAVPIRSFQEPRSDGSGGGAQTNDLGEYEMAVNPGEYAVLVAVARYAWPMGTYADRSGGMLIRDPRSVSITGLYSDDGRFQFSLPTGLGAAAATQGWPA